MTTSLAIAAKFDPGSRSHAATNDAVAHSAGALGLTIEPRWIGTAELAGPDSAVRLAGFCGIWIGPGSPYVGMDGTLAAIHMARELGIPILGTCGGFQHIILEHARNVLGFTDAEHEELHPKPHDSSFPDWPARWLDER